MKNPRNAGAKPKYKEGVEITRLQRRVPTEKITEIDNAINKICEDLKTKKNV
jgi:hypothetical protein